MDPINVGLYKMQEKYTMSAWEELKWSYLILLP